VVAVVAVVELVFPAFAFAASFRLSNAIVNLRRSFEFFFTAAATNALRFSGLNRFHTDLFIGFFAEGFFPRLRAIIARMRADLPQRPRRFLPLRFLFTAPNSSPNDASCMADSS
jgi:hypothetical protein